MRHRTNGGLMLGQGRRRWPNIKPTFVQRILIGCTYVGVTVDMRKGVAFLHNCNNMMRVGQVL